MRLESGSGGPTDLMEKNDDVKAFNENGFVVIPEFLTEPEIAPISDEVDRIISGRANDIPEDSIVYEPGSLPRQVRNVFALHRLNALFGDFVRHPRLVAIIERILGRPLRLYSSQLFAKPAAVGSVVPLHQDMPYWPFAPYELISAWFALDDSTLENGCVRFLPGSHKMGLLKHVPSGIVGNSLKLEDDRVEGIREFPVEVKRGSCVLHHCLTAHRSESNRSARPRRGLICIYMSPQVHLTDPDKLRGPADFPVVSRSV